MKKNILDDMKTLDLIAHIGSNLGVSSSAHGFSLYFDIKAVDYETKEESFDTSIEVNIESTLKPRVIYTESMDCHVPDEEHLKIINIMGYCAYHQIEFILNDRPTINTDK